MYIYIYICNEIFKYHTSKLIFNARRNYSTQHVNDTNHHLSPHNPSIERDVSTTTFTNTTIITMARTKQTARKTTGGKAPRYGGKERLASKGVLRRAAQHKKPRVVSKSPTATARGPSPSVRFGVTKRVLNSSSPSYAFQGCVGKSSRIWGKKFVISLIGE